MGRYYNKKNARKLVKYGGRIMTVGHAVSCARKGFVGCSRAEMVAAGKVLSRTISAFRRRR